jgi:two-component system cell cycle sensor histidine kinase PleC
LKLNSLTDEPAGTDWPEREAAERGRAMDRDKAVEQVRVARRKLAQGSDIKPEFQYELLSMFVRNELGAVATIQFLAVVFSLASISWAPWQEAILWLLLVIASKVALLELCRRFISTPRAEVNVKLWTRHLIMAELVSGLVWAGFALIGAGSSDASSHVFILASLIVVLAIRMTFASTGVHVYFLFLAKGLNATALAMLEYRAEKDALIAELENEKAISDEGRRRAEAANVAKSRFLATMSHELRTPLNAILGFSEVMKSEILGPMENKSYKEYAGNIHDSGRHLLHLINEILDLSRIEAGRYELQEQPVRLIDVAEDCHRLLKLRAESKGLDIALELDQDLPQIWVDERAIRQICLNLLSNALKFTPKGGRITLRLAATGDGGQMLSVKDTGPGIPKDEIPKVLQAFGQGSLAHQTAEGGTGLGLPIVQNLVELHGGKFELRSELRRGTEALVMLPKGRVMAAMPPLQPLGEERHRRTPAERGPRPPRLRLDAEPPAPVRAAG